MTCFTFKLHIAAKPQAKEEINVAQEVESKKIEEIIQSVQKKRNYERDESDVGILCFDILPTTLGDSTKRRLITFQYSMLF